MELQDFDISEKIEKEFNDWFDDYINSILDLEDKKMREVVYKESIRMKPIIKVGFYGCFKFKKCVLNED